MGVPLKITSDVEQREMTRSTVGEVYARIVADMTEATRLFKMLPERLQVRKSNRVNLPAAQLLLARAYLYSERWEEAATVAGELIARTDFPLIDLQSLVDQGYKNLPANQRKYYNFISYDNPECYWLWGNAVDALFFTHNIVERNLGNARNYSYLLQASKEFLDCFEPGDARPSLYIVSDVNANSYTGYGAFGKHPMLIETSQNLLPREGNMDFGWALRKAEAYLIAAESHAMLHQQGTAGAGEKAISALNALRSKRFLTSDYVALTLADFTNAKALVEMARAERRRELCFESLRWFDQRRHGMKRVEHRWYIGPDTTADEDAGYENYVLEENDPGFTFPIPHTIIEQNSNLVQVPTVGLERTGSVH
jgi:hypothetical protein